MQDNLNERPPEPGRLSANLSAMWLYTKLSTLGYLPA